MRECHSVKDNETLSCIAIILMFHASHPNLRPSIPAGP